MDDRLMTIQELAAYLGVATKTVYHWRYRGEGPLGVAVGGQVRYRSSDVEAWLEANTDERATHAPA